MINAGVSMSVSAIPKVPGSAPSVMILSWLILGINALVALTRFQGKQNHLTHTKDLKIS